MDLNRIHNAFIDIVATELDVVLQQEAGVPHHKISRERGVRRYLGIPREQLPKHHIELNTFKPVVNKIVAQLMYAITEKPESLLYDSSPFIETGK